MRSDWATETANSEANTHRSRSNTTTTSQLPSNTTSADDRSGLTETQAQQQFDIDITSRRQLVALQRLEQKHGKKVNDWLNEGMPHEALGVPEKMRTFRRQNHRTASSDDSHQSRSVQPSKTETRSIQRMGCAFSSTSKIQPTEELGTDDVEELQPTEWDDVQATESTPEAVSSQALAREEDLEIPDQKTAKNIQEFNGNLKEYINKRWNISEGVQYLDHILQQTQHHSTALSDPAVMAVAAALDHKYRNLQDTLLKPNLSKYVRNRYADYFTTSQRNEKMLHDLIDTKAKLAVNSIYSGDIKTDLKNLESFMPSIAYAATVEPSMYNQAAELGSIQIPEDQQLDTVAEMDKMLNDEATKQYIIAQKGALKQRLHNNTEIQSLTARLKTLLAQS